MRIAQVAPPFESIPPPRYGGTERVIYTLTEALVRRGHEVTLFASGDSRTSAKLVPVVGRALWRRKPPLQDLPPFNAVVLGKLVEYIDQFDLVHNHLDYWAFPLSHLLPCPMVTTLHGQLDLPELQALYQTFPRVPLVSISDAQRAPLASANWVATVYHGIELQEYTFNPKPDGYLAFIGRISPEKGLDTAIKISRRVGIPLKIAARQPLQFSRDPNVRKDWRYFDGVIEPLLSEPGIEFVGEVGGRDKDLFLGNARALLFPIRWPEPFGLVMVEALACETPVVALRAGSVPEVIGDGVTGRVCESEDELAEAVDRVDEIDRARCRAEAERRFPPEVMAERYEEVYRRLIEGRANA